jgi:hypothetical protein
MLGSVTYLFSIGRISLFGPARAAYAPPAPAARANLSLQNPLATWPVQPCVRGPGQKHAGSDLVGSCSLRLLLIYATLASA